MPLPRFIEPALPVLRPEPPSGPAWAHEVKFDGWRFQIRHDGINALILSRNGLDLTNRFPSLARAIAQLPATCILDAELVSIGPDGLPDFDAVGTRCAEHSLCVFDALHRDGMDLRGLPLSDRRQHLAEMAPAALQPMLCVIDGFTDPVSLLAALEAKGMEGIVSKRLDAPYRSGARSGWVKVKTHSWRARHALRWERMQARAYV